MNDVYYRIYQTNRNDPIKLSYPNSRVFVTISYDHCKQGHTTYYFPLKRADEIYNLDVDEKKLNPSKEWSYQEDKERGHASFHETLEDLGYIGWKRLFYHATKQRFYYVLVLFSDTKQIIQQDTSLSSRDILLNWNHDEGQFHLVHETKDSQLAKKFYEKVKEDTILAVETYHVFASNHYLFYAQEYQMLMRLFREADSVSEIASFCRQSKKYFQQYLSELMTEQESTSVLLYGKEAITRLFDDITAFIQTTALQWSSVRLIELLLIHDILIWLQDDLTTLKEEQLAHLCALLLEFDKQANTITLKSIGSVFQNIVTKHHPFVMENTFAEEEVKSQTAYLT